MAPCHFRNVWWAIEARRCEKEFQPFLIAVGLHPPLPPAPGNPPTHPLLASPPAGGWEGIVFADWQHALFRMSETRRPRPMLPT